MILLFNLLGNSAIFILFWKWKQIMDENRIYGKINKTNLLNQKILKQTPFIRLSYLLLMQNEFSFLLLGLIQSHSDFVMEKFEGTRKKSSNEEHINSLDSSWIESCNFLQATE